MRLPHGFADDVRNQSDIVRIVSDYVTLKKSGASFIARCPFHSEKTPSFNVHPGKGLFKCFGCGVGGDVFGFVMQIEGCPFPEAVRIVAEKSGIPIPALRDDEEFKKQAHDRDVVLRLNESAAEFFEKQLHDGPEGERARLYVQARGISDESCRLFRLGYAPDRWDALVNHLKEQGASADEISASGLVVSKEQGGFYDRFRGRLMFPITDSQGRVVAFGGRVIGDGEPKYLNSPETALYTKGRNLYGLGSSKASIRQAGFAILVEGYLDCIIPYQEGVHNVVATLGTALTESQIRLLKRYMAQPKVIVNFDPDSAGQSAALRSIDLLLGENVKVNVLTLPAGRDPDEFVRAHGAEEFKALLKSTQPYIEFVIDKAIGDYDIARPSGKVAAINAILPHLARMNDRVERADYAAQIANRLKLDSDILRAELKRVAKVRKSSLDQNRIRAAQDSMVAEERLLSLLLSNEDVRRAIVPNLNDGDYDDLGTGAVYRAVVDTHNKGLEPDLNNLTNRLDDEVLRSLLPGLMIGDLWWARGESFDDLFKEATELLCSLRRRRLEKQLDIIQVELGQAERDGNADRVLKLFEEKTEIQRRKLALITANQ